MRRGGGDRRPCPGLESRATATLSVAVSTSERGFGLQVRAVLRPAWDRNESAAWAAPLAARRKGRRLLRASGDGEPRFTPGAAGRDGDAREGAARREGKGSGSGSVALGFRKCFIYRFLRGRELTRCG